MTITKIERNLVFTTIENAGLDPRTCKLTKNTIRDLNIEHPATGSYFKIYQRRWIDKRRIFIDPYVPMLLTTSSTSVMHQSYYRWDDVVPVHRNWAGLVLEREERLRRLDEQRKAEKEIPDLWTLPPDWNIPESQDIPNSPFTPQERETIAGQLREIKEYVKRNYELSEAKFARIEERLDEAAEATSRMGRKDWLLLFGGVVLTLMVTDLVPPAVVEHIFNGITQGLAHLLGGNQGHRIIEAEEISPPSPST